MPDKPQSNPVFTVLFTLTIALTGATILGALAGWSAAIAYTVFQVLVR